MHQPTHSDVPRGVDSRPSEDRQFVLTTGLAQDGVSPDETIRILALKLFSTMPKPSMIDLADLQQAGSLGLLQAKRTYDASMGVPLAAYAKHRIRGEMLEAVHRARPSGARPRNEMHARAAFVPVEEWRELAPQGKTGSAMEDMLVARQRHNLLSGEVDRMPSRYKMVLRMKYANDLTLREIGAEMQVKESRACQLHKSALGILRRALTRKGVTGLHRVY